MNRIIPSPEVRAWIYRVIAAAGIVAVGYGLLTAEQGNLWLVLAGAILTGSNGLAAANVPTLTASERFADDQAARARAGLPPV